jgi:hypothetical protein
MFKMPRALPPNCQRTMPTKGDACVALRRLARCGLQRRQHHRFDGLKGLETATSVRQWDRGYSRRLSPDRQATRNNFFRRSLGDRDAEPQLTAKSLVTALETTGIEPATSDLQSRRSPN